MKNGWVKKSISEVCDVLNGGTPKTGVADYWDGPHRWITPAEMGRRPSPYVEQTGRTLSDAGLANCSARLLPSQSVILSSRAPIGHLVINTEPMAFNQGCKGLVSDKTLYHKFLYYYLSSIVDLLNSLGTGATFKELSSRKLKEVGIPVPGIPEQRRIVRILDEAFDGIATAKAAAEKNLQNARELFVSYLNGVFTQRGEGWVEKPIGDVCNLLNGFAFKSKHALPKSETQLVRIGNLYGNRLDLNRKPVFYPDRFAEEFQRFVLRDGDLIMSLTGTKGKEDYGFAVIIPKCHHTLLLNQRVAKFDSIEESLVIRDYLFYFLRSRRFLDILYPTANGTRQGNLSSVTIKTLPIPLCRVDKQQLIVRNLNEFTTETQLLESIYRRKLAALDELKKSLLHQAFSGEL